jgi:hypothetical protein
MYLYSHRSLIKHFFSSRISLGLAALAPLNVLQAELNSRRTSLYAREFGVDAVHALKASLSASMPQVLM